MSSSHERAAPPACPRCGQVILHVRTMSGASCGPTPGAATICTGCAGLMTFDLDLEPRLPTFGELIRIPECVWREIDTARRTLSLVRPNSG